MKKLRSRHRFTKYFFPNLMPTVL